MTADVELPPLPEWTKRDDAGQNMVPSEIRVSMAVYARAYAARATAAKDAEIEALLAENKGHGIAIQQLCDRAERLAEALRECIALGHPRDPSIIAARAAQGDQGGDIGSQEQSE